MTVTRQPAGDAHMTAREFGIEPGLRVVGNDNRRLGAVSDVHGRYFKVHPRRFFATDYWLDLREVSGVFGDCVVVEFAKRAAHDHEVPGKVVNDERLDARADRLLDDAEMQAQRERMERDLGRH